MSKRYKLGTALLLLAPLALAQILVSAARAGAAREEGRLLTATEVLEEVQGMPDQRIPDALLAHAYGIAVIPDVTNLAFIFGGRHGNGVMSVRRDLNAPWSNPVCVALTGGSWGLQAGVQSADIILVFTTQRGVEGVSGGKFTLGADASVAAGPVGRQGSVSTDPTFNAEIYSYARTRGLFGGIALEGSVLAIDRSANASLYHQQGITATDIISGRSSPPPEAGQRFLARLASSAHGAVRAAPAAAAPAAATAPPPAQSAPPPSAADAPRTYPLEEPK
ncbi:MAG TPA: lipid-binding SYLF domain-containing protein [Steroidobacteraceae bacterium]|nr:lipid-binding SYLF domain-containing protein [Steroidobacteraceae bacterium]